MKASTLLASAIAVVLSDPELAFADCQTVSASDVAQNIQNCPSANNALKNNACNFGGAAIAESGGNTCASNGNNFGVLQLTRSNLTNTGYSPSQYLNLSAQQQVCIWAQQVGNSNTSGAYQTLSNSGSVNGTPVTAGMLAACFQFGPLICRNDLAFMQANGGACPSIGNGGVRATGQTLSNGGANLDGNNQSICSWGQSIQNKINQAATTCNASNGSGGDGTNCPGGGTTPGGVIPPSPGNAPVSLPANLA
ncbi:MAG: hypothetical protein EKK29_14080 [Hyphomicrobiales bacterium]|nr:MAG: hypothetical protein EKK29_14080 [Hyphomicrobiales bacterium]